MESTPASAVPTSHHRLQRSLVALPLAAAGVLVVLGGYAGRYVRPTADDWCVLAHLHQVGPAGLARYYYESWSGRVAKGIPEGLVWDRGYRGAQLLPAFLIVVLCTGTWLALRMGLRRCGLAVPPALVGALAIGATGLTLLAGSVPYQVAYWVASSMTHVAPTAIAVWAVVIALAAAGRSSWWGDLVVVTSAGLAGLLLGLWSEAFVPVGVLYGGTFGVLNLLRSRTVRGDRLRAMRLGAWWAALWVGGLLLGLLVMYTSPGLSSRRGLTDGALLNVGSLADVMHGWGHTWLTLGSAPAYYAMIVLGFLIGVLLPSGAGDAIMRPGRVRVVLPALLALLASLAIIVELYLAYGANGWRYERTWTNFLFPLLLTAAYYGAVFGVRVRLLGTRRTLLVAGATVLTTVAFVSVVPRTWHLTEDMRTRAAIWGRSDTRIRAEIARGDSDPVYRPARIEGSTEPFMRKARKNDWAARCVAAAYGVPSITPPAWKERALTAR